MKTLDRPTFPSCAAVIGLLAALAAFSGCYEREPGADLTREVGPREADSAAVANQPPPTVWEYVPPTPRHRETVEAPGVQRGFGDASGGISLTGHAPNGYPASLVEEPMPTVAGAEDGAVLTDPEATAWIGRQEASAGTDLEQRVRAVIERLQSELPAVQLDGVEVLVQGNEVVLRGTVPDATTADALTEVLTSMPGLVRVRSELQYGKGDAAE